MSSVLSCFLFYFHCSSSQFTQPSPLPSLPCSGWPGPCDLAVRATPPRPPALRPPWVAWASAAWAAPGRAVPSGESPPRQRPRASSGVRAVGAAAACRRLVPGTLEPVVGRPWRPLSERSFPSATFTRAAIQPANTAQRSRGRHHWQQQSRCFGDLGKPAPAEDWTCSILGGGLEQWE